MKLSRAIEGASRYLIHSDKAGKPMVCYWMITKKCNLRCKMCTYWKEIYKEELDTDDVKRILNKLGDVGVSVLNLTGGEPLMRKDISEILNCAKFVCNIDYVRLITNGVLLTEDVIDSCVSSIDDIWLSIDGVGEVHDKIRGVNGTFSRIEKNIEHLNSRQDRPSLVINTVVSRYNVREVSKIVRLAEEWRATQLMFHHVVDVKDDVHTGQFSSEEELFPIGDIRIPESKIPIYVDPWLRSGKPDRGDRRGCLILYTSMMINPVGDVIPCGIFDKIILGNLVNEELEDIWNGDKMKKFRKMIWKGRPECSGCCVPRTTLWSRLSDTFNMRRVI